MKRLIIGTTIGFLLGSAMAATSYAPASLVVEQTVPTPYKLIIDGVEQPPMPPDPSFPMYIYEGEQIVFQIGDQGRTLFDGSGDKKVGLEDAILALQIITGIRSAK